MVINYTNLTVSETKPGIFLVKHSNGKAIKFKTTATNFLNSKSVGRKLEYFDKYGVMVGYK